MLKKRKKRKRIVELCAYMEPVNDDGYPREDRGSSDILCVPTFALRTLPAVKSQPRDSHREARILYHMMRVQEEQNR